MDFTTILNVISMGIKAGTPLLLVALGGIIVERSGVFNLGYEGLMLIGAVVAFRVAMITQEKWSAVLITLIVCGILGLIFAFITVTLRVNQIASGIALVILLTGLSSVIGKPVIGMIAGDQFNAIKLDFLPSFLKPIFEQDALIYITILIAIISWIFLFKTRAGLHLRAAGENPGTIDSLGVNVFRIRYAAMIVSCMFAGLAGAYLSLAYTPLWVEGMSAGRGWLAMALVSFALWNPMRAIFGSYLFGIVYALSIKLEAVGIAIPSSFLRMLPYILPIIILLMINIRGKFKGSVAPSACGIPYIREGK